LIANAAGIPSAATVTAAAAGPIARARLYVIELSASALRRSDGGTSDDTNACEAGAENAEPTPSASEKPITTATPASPANASAASTAVSAAAPSCVTRITFRRSNRSATAPVHGARTTTAANCAKLRTPSSSAECVSR
jgi:hypothetical protein